MSKTLAAIVFAVVCLASPAFSQDLSSVELLPAVNLGNVALADQFALWSPVAQQPVVIPPTVNYSHAYETRARIHKIASYTMLPLAGSEIIAGQSTFDNNGGSMKGAHVAIGTAIGGLFAVNSVTGVWNLVESRKDPHNRGIRLFHSILMLGADAGFVATVATAPGDHEGGSSGRNTHRAVALTSI